MKNKWCSDNIYYTPNWKVHFDYTTIARNELMLIACSLKFILYEGVLVYKGRLQERAFAANREVGKRV